MSQSVTMEMSKSILRLGEVLEAGTSKTYSVDITGLKNMGIGVYSGYFCNAEVTNIYLS